VGRPGDVGAVTAKQKTRQAQCGAGEKKARQRDAWRVMQAGLVGRAGFEPATKGLKVLCSTN
jgi:hypothetical protein